MRAPKIRSVGPSFFMDEEIVALSPHARLVFLALCCMADDQGVYRAKPVTIKTFALPADDVDIVPLLGELASLDLVREFRADGSDFGAIRGWGRHQKPQDARALHPLPEELDSFVRLDELRKPRSRKDREDPVWPLRPKDPAPSGGRQADVPGTSNVEGRGEDGTGGKGSGPECTADRPLTPPPNGDSDWPFEVSHALAESLHTRLIAPLESFVSRKTMLTQLSPEDLRRGLVQAIVRLSKGGATDPSLGRLLAGDDAARDRVVGEVKSWLARVEEGARLARTKRPFLKASMQRGPCEGWELPGFGKQPANSGRQS